MIKPWDEYFMEIAKTCASRSNCLRANVGAVIVGDDKKIKATGYNGTPSKVVSCHELGYCYRIKNNIESGTRYETCRSIHAEQNAIIQAGQDRAGIIDVYLQKETGTPIVHVSVEDIKKELSEMAMV